MIIQKDKIYKFHFVIFSSGVYFGILISFKYITFPLFRFCSVFFCGDFRCILHDFLCDVPYQAIRSNSCHTMPSSAKGISSIQLLAGVNSIFSVYNVSALGTLFGFFLGFGGCCLQLRVPLVVVCCL